MNPYNFLWIVGGFVSLGFALGIGISDKNDYEADIFSIIITLGFLFILSWAGVIASIISIANEENK